MISGARRDLGGGWRATAIPTATYYDAYARGGIPGHLQPGLGLIRFYLRFFLLPRLRAALAAFRLRFSLAPSCFFRLEGPDDSPIIPSLSAISDEL